jgi:hypothetical protein
MKLAATDPDPPFTAPEFGEYDAASIATELGMLLAMPDTEDLNLGDKVRFGTQLPPQTLLFLHRLAYWSRGSITDIVDAALLHYLSTIPTALSHARKPLSEKERIKRKQPRR